jgi:hypothetical protein
LSGRITFDDQQFIELLIDLGWINAEPGQDGVLQQTLNPISPSGQKEKQGGENQHAAKQIQQDPVRETVMDGDDDACNKEAEGHAQ